jgi:tRNA (cytidine/uridine-2'-O-)-methyltransferase
MNVVLVEPEIPPNTGNIARLCAATGAMLHLVGPLGFRLDERELKRAGMDYWEQVRWRYWESWEALRSAMPAVAEFYLVENRTERLYTQARYRRGDYLVFGRESSGLPVELVRANAGRVIAIPMFNPAARSLNLATAVAVVLYEAMRQVEGF